MKELVLGSVNSRRSAKLVKFRSTLVWFLSHRSWAGIGVIFVIVIALINQTNLIDSLSLKNPPPFPGVYSLRDISAGERLTEDMLETRGENEPVTHLHPVRLEQVVALCLAKEIEKNTQLTLKHLQKCPD